VEGIAHDFYLHREKLLTEVEKLSANTVSSMKKSVLQMPLIKAQSAKEASGKYEVMRDLEYMRLNLEKIMRSTQDKVTRSVLFSKWAVEELDVLFEGTIDSFTKLSEYIKQCCEKGRMTLAEEADKQIANCYKFTKQHEERFSKGICNPESAAIYQSMLDAFRNLFMHVKSCVIKVYGQ
jgi:Na+/phosphate symporter